MLRTVCSLQESYWQPCDLQSLLRFFEARALPGVELVDAERLIYRRTIDLAALSPGLRAAGSRPAVLQVDFGGGFWAEVDVRAMHRKAIGEDAAEAVGRGVRRLFDLETTVLDLTGFTRAPEFQAEGLSATDVRIPGSWDRFETAVRAVLGQQISVAGARTLAGRLVTALGDKLPGPLREVGLERTFPTPEQVAAFDPRTIGVPASRARALRDLAAEVAAGRLRLDADPAVVRERLLAIKGIGPWTVEYVAMRALGDADAFPAGDLGLRKAVNREEPPTPLELEAMAESWRPLRAYAALLLWKRVGGG